MMRKLVASIVIAVTLAPLTGALSETETPYEVDIGDSEDYLVPGSDAFLRQDTGQASITLKVPVGNDLLVRVACASNSDAICTGMIVSS